MQVFAMRYVEKPALTREEIQALPPGRYYRGHGLVLIVTPTSRQWRYRFTRKATGKVTEVTIGEWPTYSYADAREEAYQLKAKIAKGHDPVEARRQQRLAAATSFADVREDFVNTHRSKWRGLKNVNNFLGNHGKPLAKKPIGTITSDMIVAALSDLWKRHPEQARRTLRMWKKLFDYAKVMGYCDGENPARWEGNLEHRLIRQSKGDSKHHKALPFQYMSELIFRLQQRQVRSTAAAALEFLILTATRSDETLGMRWSEVDLFNAIWTLPKERTKENREHSVPLSQRCMEILSFRNEYRTNDFVFTGYKGRALDPKSMRELLRNMGVRVTVHGFRSSFRDWAAENRPLEERPLHELCLGHKGKGQVESAYWRSNMLKQRRPIMQAWSAYCDPATS
jgi:integrase